MEGNPYYVKPADFSGGMNAAMSGFQSYVDDTAKLNEKTKQEDIQTAIAKAVSTGDLAKIREVSTKYPAEVVKFQTADASRMGIVKQTRAETARKILTGELPLEQGLDQHAENLLNTGVDAGETLLLAKLARSNPEQALKAVQTMYALNATPEEWKNYSDFAGIGSSANSAKTFQKTGSFYVKDAQGNVSVATGVFDPVKGVLRTERGELPPGFTIVSELGETADDKKKRDVSTAIDKKQGTDEIEIKTEKQKLLNEYEIKLAKEPTLENAKEVAKRRAELSYAAAIEKAKSEGAAITADTTKKLEQINNLGGSISILKDAISQIDSGADTGKITNLFPSFRASTIQLNNLKSQLGLSVVQSATFGALSESELKFALDTAMPTNLQPAELRAWLVRKESAQQKLLDGFKRYTIKLNTPGMTRAKVLESGYAPPASGIKTIASEQEYQSLPNGAEYMYDGQKYKKGQ